MCVHFKFRDESSGQFAWGNPDLHAVPLVFSKDFYK